MRSAFAATSASFTAPIVAALEIPPGALTLIGALEYAVSDALRNNYSERAFVFGQACPGADAPARERPRALVERAMMDDVLQNRGYENPDKKHFWYKTFSAMTECCLPDARALERWYPFSSRVTDALFIVPCQVFDAPLIKRYAQAVEADYIEHLFSLLPILAQGSSEALGRICTMQLWTGVVTHKKNARTHLTDERRRVLSNSLAWLYRGDRAAYEKRLKTVTAAGRDEAALEAITPLTDAIEAAGAGRSGLSLRQRYC